ncbi:Zinc finger A20 and AN1 domain-containing stress-associated protein 6 [Acorus gramineus]|uniref:Zinc finger A20 and AN1 domain-containing stress-associated protein 6 n=1 Tax=Acorus gramineus TaxID=55184 RepID=A0AAV9ADE8_ACOGR|nr:Zinc finger A20 and AN1 domain-containing stress-associated protein 6 [Acorus gramineus]
MASEPRLCANGCGFFGTKENKNMCSKCFLKTIVLQNMDHVVASLTSTTITPVSAAASATTTSTFDAPHNVSEGVTSRGGEEKRRERCASCGKRLGLIMFPCRCGFTFCGAHRYAEAHHCSLDLRSIGRERIAKENPLIKSDKLNRRL